MCLARFELCAMVHGKSPSNQHYLILIHIVSFFPSILCKSKWRLVSQQNGVKRCHQEREIEMMYLRSTLGTSRSTLGTSPSTLGTSRGRSNLNSFFYEGNPKINLYDFSIGERVFRQGTNYRMLKNGMFFFL